MKKRVTMLTLFIIVVALCIFTQGTFAWFTDTTYNQRIFEIGDIKYIYSDTLVNTGLHQLVVPGETLISNENQSLFLTNQSNIDTNLRVKIKYSFKMRDSQTITDGVYSNLPNDPLNNFMSVQMVPQWSYNTTDTCWYYQYNSSEIIPASPTENIVIPLITAISFDGNKVTNDQNGATFTITMVFQAKQANFVDWATIGTAEIDG